MYTKIGYTEAQKKQTNKKRKRNILWFNPSWSNTVSTNVASKFLHLINKHFKGSLLKKILN